MACATCHRFQPFSHGAAVTPAIEALAAALLLANVWLVAQRSLWNYAFGIAAVSLYAAVFWNARLYAAFGLQFLFLALNIYGLMHWRRARQMAGVVPVGWMGWPTRLATLLGVLVLTAAIATLLLRTTDAVQPWWDSANTGTALAAQWLQARRRVETWPLWVTVNVSSVGLYATESLWFTAATYAILLRVALMGWRQWARAAT